MINIFFYLSIPQCTECACVSSVIDAFRYGDRGRWGQAAGQSERNAPPLRLRASVRWNSERRTRALRLASTSSRNTNYLRLNIINFTLKQITSVTCIGWLPIVLRLCFRFFILKLQLEVYVRSFIILTY